ncbi:colanic acid/amylovoran biosynthesis glycosyltransferase [Bizionia echini]|uniref:Colanic acid/amylovoran biosynthesis glycosyltransferase n=1 Tax=Bizionia echini TaxID=649333 RepID=A0A1I5BCG8_9FLAO|nr:glycosyltransferase family 4 protein [Bizionia echini]SFN72414.1 colanic acid/amylovoran biosynthesis glycosyltransferase [Bizionia echini]
MKTSLKIAIYSGEIPSTTFIERLISGLVGSGASVLIFGILREKPRYSSGVTVVGYQLNRFAKFWHLARYTLLLTLFKRGDKKRFDVYLQQQQKTDLYTKVKCYPVLWHRPDVFHLQWAKGLADWVWVQDFGMKLVVSLRGAHINYSPIADTALAAMYREYFPKVDGFHAVSEAIGLEAQTYGAHPEAIHVVYSGLPASEMEAEMEAGIEPVVKPKNLPAKPFQIVSVGRPHWKKGYTYALDACKLLKEKGTLFEYTIIGGAHVVDYQYQIVDLELDNEVRLLSQKPFNEVQRLILNADLLLLSSVEEGIANVVLEAMALGTLVLSTDCGGMDEVIHDGETGFLVPIRDAQALADAIIAITSLPTAAALKIKKQAQLKIKEQHSEALMTSGMMRLYEGLFVGS